ncbi:hypothetical protein [Nonomuraea sp. LPB2021202275-12-8]|uniref:hypothetical protein n=1 Tax=Nonomuraea sp. LPB2021202275-12-8 TaxID=3120159 RepID=UPI00300BFF75
MRTSGLRSRAGHADGDAETMLRQRNTLRDEFLFEGNPLGHDQYGAELAKRLPQIRDGIMDAFDACVTEAEGIRDRLGENAWTYDTAEHGISRTTGG